MGPKNDVGPLGGIGGDQGMPVVGHTCACPDFPTVDKLKYSVVVIGDIRPFAVSSIYTVATHS